MTGMLPTSLTGRLVATAVFLVAAVSVLIGAAATLGIRAYLTGQLDEELNRSSDRAVMAVEEGLPLLAGPPAHEGPDDVEDEKPRPKDDIGFGQGIGTLTAYIDDGLRYGGVLERQGRGADSSALDSGVLDQLAEVPSDGDAHTVQLPGLGSYRVLVTEVDDAVVVSGLPTDDVDDTIGNLILYEGVLSLAGVLLAGVGGWILVRRQLRPLRDVAKTAHDVAALPLSTGEVAITPRVPSRLTDERSEVGQVGEALNTLLGQVEQALAERHRSEQHVRRFVADASHELRTPLAVIKGYAELSGRTQADDPDQLLKNLDKVHVEASRMSALVDDLLLLARLDAGRPLDRDDVDLTRLVLESVVDAQVVAPDHEWILDLPDEPVIVVGDDQRLHQVVSNLLSNARRHTPAGTRVSATVARSCDGESATLTVEDDGPGLPEKLRGQVFERFARGDTARTRAAGGTGLGLSLVKAIVDAHGGSIAVDSRPGLTRFVVTLPLSSSTVPSPG